MYATHMLDFLSPSHAFFSISWLRLKLHKLSNYKKKWTENETVPGLVDFQITSALHSNVWVGVFFPVEKNLPKYVSVG